jgi:hypothetical protein
MRKPLSAAFSLLFGCIGCATHTVVVTDAAGNPVAGADVIPVGLSINGAPVKTDAKGEASIPESAGGQDAKWINVSKSGYAPVQAGVPAAWPLRVMLATAPAAGPATRSAITLPTTAPAGAP